MVEINTNMEIMGINDKEYYDMHCHVLPGMDDGCKQCQESAKVLEKSFQQGIKGLAATPHYYPQETVSHFLRRRQKAFDKLQEYLEIKNVNSPEICLGAEVAYHSGLINETDINKLCYGNSSFLLLEMPFMKWQSNVLRDVQGFRSMHGITPVIAHLERYLKIQDKSVIEELLGFDVIVQMNAGYIIDFWGWHQAKKMLQNGTVQILGSDCHGLSKRPPNLGMAMDRLKKKGFEDCINEINDLSCRIFNAALYENSLMS